MYDTHINNMYQYKQQQATQSTTNQSQLTWHTLHNTIHTPSARTYFTMNSYNNKLYIFGGFGDNKTRYNDIYIYDTIHNTWTVHQYTNQHIWPKPVYLHTTVQYNEYLYMFGGSCGRDSNDLYRYDLNNNTFFKFLSSSTTPSPRYGHAACICNNTMYIVGGCTHSQNDTIYYQDAYVYDFTNNQWTRIADIPMDLAYHQLISHNNTVYLLGGYNGARFSPYTYMYNKGANKWTVVNVTGREPPPLCGSATAYNQLNNELYLFGGYTAYGHTNDLYRLCLNTMKWELIDAQNRPVSRAYLQCAYVDDTIYLYGGYDGKQCIADMRYLKISKSINVLKAIHEYTIEQQCQYITQHYGATIEYKQLHAILTNIKQHMQQNNDTNNKSNDAKKLYDLDTSRVNDLIDLGFSRTHIMTALNQYRQQGIDTSNYEQIVDLLLTNSITTHNNGEIQRTLTIEQQLHDSKICKICYDHEINCALLHCGHLCVCTGCAANLVQNKQPCPLCRKSLASFLKVYYT